jgi:hypothetical protein
MLQRGRLGEFRRRADVRLEVRRMYPVQKAVARAAEPPRFAGQPGALANRLTGAIRRFGQMIGKVVRHGLGQYLRVHRSSKD